MSRLGDTQVGRVPAEQESMTTEERTAADCSGYVGVEGVEGTEGLTGTDGAAVRVTPYTPPAPTPEDDSA
jgi:hypothetical protein